MCFGNIPDMAKIQEAIASNQASQAGWTAAVVLVVTSDPLRRSHRMMVTILAFMEEMTVDHKADDLAHAEQVINEIERGMLLTV